MKLKHHSADVYLAPQPVSIFGNAERKVLLDQLPQSRFGRVRINMHQDDASNVHEMFIAIAQNSYVRPHRHQGKSESFHVVHGELDVVLFSDEGTIDQVIPMAPHDVCFYRLSAPLFHTVLPRTQAIILHEVTDGPFAPEQTEQAFFAPAADQTENARAYQANLNVLVENWKNRQ